MAISLEELKRQREQIQKHLEWLDAQIAGLETSSQKESEQSVPSTVSPEASTQNTETVKSQEEPSKTAPLPEHDPEAPHYKAKTKGELRRAQFGCLALFILSNALFLFLLFGLPYLLPEKAEDTTDPIIEEIDLDAPPENEPTDAPLE